jgi:serine/threonine-protein kinase
LNFAHEHGGIHRDLKPQNILLDTQGDAILCAFGITPIITGELTAMTRTGATMGTPLYMAPEQWRAGDMDHRTDIYAFGVMLYQMLTGRLLFEGADPYNIMYKHLLEDWPHVMREVDGVNSISSTPVTSQPSVLGRR